MPEVRPKGPRDTVAGPEGGSEPPFPIRLSGPVIKGFGRGSREVSRRFRFYVVDAGFVDGDNGGGYENGSE